MLEEPINSCECSLVLSWGSFYAFVLRLHLCFESLHVCTDRKVNINVNAQPTQTQMLTRRHCTTTVYNLFAKATLTQRKHNHNDMGASALGSHQSVLK